MTLTIHIRGRKDNEEVAEIFHENYIVEHVRYSLGTSRNSGRLKIYKGKESLL
jgi:ribosomal protein S24E